MLKTFGHKLGPNWKGALLSLVLGTSLLGLGYWLGQRSPRQEANNAQVANKREVNGLSSPPRVTIPANATPEIKEFLQNRAALAAKMAELPRQRGSDAPNPQAVTQFQNDNANLLKRQNELAQIIAQQQAQNPLSTPPPLQIPPNATPQLKAFLTARDQLLRDQIAFQNQHPTDTPEVRQAAMQQWRQQNAPRFQQVQQMAKALQPSNSPQPASPPASGK